MVDAIVINAKDNVAVALEDLKAGDIASVASGDKNISVALRQPIPFGHKFALRPIQKGERIIKYGETIGRASSPIASGDHVHTQNVDGTRGRGDLAGALR